jgi:hypothetical protein
MSLLRLSRNRAQSRYTLDQRCGIPPAEGAGRCACLDAADCLPKGGDSDELWKLWEEGRHQEKGDQEKEVSSTEARSKLVPAIRGGMNQGRRPVGEAGLNYGGGLRLPLPGKYDRLSQELRTCPCVEFPRRL